MAARWRTGKPRAARSACSRACRQWAWTGSARPLTGRRRHLTILVPVGAVGLAAIGPVTWIILALLAILFFSYWQTITAYPSSGGSYTVAKENLGANAGLLAAAALMVDYTLNVAVGISAGIGAFTSAIPALHPYTLPLCLGVLASVTLVNLRGTRESGLMFATPTYVFIASLGFDPGAGRLEGMDRRWPSERRDRAAAVPHATEAVDALAAAARLCRGMHRDDRRGGGQQRRQRLQGTPRRPRPPHLDRDLSSFSALLLLGIAYVARTYGVMAMDETKPGYQSVLSQLVAAVQGRGWFYYVTIGSVLAVLCLSANTSFVGFPRLCQQIAHDGFLPKAFALPGRRLVYTVGILFLAGGAGLLLFAFGGITDRLIPLFAVGAFLSFTMSQAGMAAHWRRLGKGTPTGCASASTGSARLRPAPRSRSSWPPSSWRAPGSPLS